MLKFTTITEKSTLKNPLNNFARETQIIELRQDPLLGTWSRINVERAKRVHQTHGNGEISAEIIKNTCEGCFFCEKNVMAKTPELPEELKLGNRLRQGEAILFPNLYPFAKYHAVCVLAKSHGAQLGSISGINWRDALDISIRYLKAVYKTDSSAEFGSINMNYMPPAAASIIHPHLQIICDRKPSVYGEAAWKRSAEYYRKTKKNYFEELAKTDKARRIRLQKGAVWLATFSPLLANDITGIFPGKSSLFELSGADIRSMASELSQIFGALWKLGARSANLSIFSAPFFEKSNAFTLHARIGTRPALQNNYTADKGFMEVLHQETVTSTIPEDVAQRMRSLLK